MSELRPGRVQGYKDSFSERDRNVSLLHEDQSAVPSILFSDCQGYSDHSLKLGILIHLVPRLRMNGVLPQILYTFPLQNANVSTEVFLYSAMLK
jgi:hypothetical protein